MCSRDINTCKNLKSLNEICLNKSLPFLKTYFLNTSVKNGKDAVDKSKVFGTLLTDHRNQSFRLHYIAYWYA